MNETAECINRREFCAIAGGVVSALTPQGRGTFYASLDYGTKVQAAKQ